MPATHHSGTLKLVRSMMSRAVQLLRVAVHTHDIRDIYLVLGMAGDLIDEADKLICTLPDDQIFGSHKTFEDLTGKVHRLRMMTASNTSR